MNNEDQVATLGNSPTMGRFTGANTMDPYQAQLLAQAQAQSQKHIEPMETDYTEAGTVKIFNIGPRTHPVAMGGLGQFLILACPEGRVYSEPTLIWKQFPEGKNDDMTKMSMRLLDGYRVAESIVSYGQFTDPSSDLRKYGVFVAGASVTVKTPKGEVKTMNAGEVKQFIKMHRGSQVINTRKVTSAAIQAARKNGDRRSDDAISQDILEANLPTEAELDDAQKRLNEYCMRLVAEANAYYRANNLLEIQDIHRWAGEYTNNHGLPWMQGAILKKKCIACATPNDPDAAICSNANCGMVLKPEIVIAARLPKYAHLWDPSHPAYEGPKAKPKKTATEGA